MGGGLTKPKLAYVIENGSANKSKGKPAKSSNVVLNEDQLEELEAQRYVQDAVIVNVVTD